MTKTISALMATVAALCVGAVAFAQVTPTQVTRLFNANGLTAEPAQNQGNVTVFPATDVYGNGIAVTLMDVEGDGIQDVAAVMALVRVGALDPVIAYRINESSISKTSAANGFVFSSFMAASRAPLADTNLEWMLEVVTVERDVIRQQFLGSASNSLASAASLVEESAEARRIDAGLSRSEITARDAAITASLNQVGWKNVGIRKDAVLSSEFAAAAAEVTRGSR